MTSTIASASSLAGGRVSFILMCLLTSVFIFVGDYSWPQQRQTNHFIDQYWPLIFVAAILIGLPHGASDPIISYRSVWHNTRDLIRFLILYLALAVLIVIIWWYLPDICFLLFWFYSAWHFGYDWSAPLKIHDHQKNNESAKKNFESLNFESLNFESPNFETTAEAASDTTKHHENFKNLLTTKGLSQVVTRLGYGLCLLGLCLLFTDDSTIKTLSIITELPHQVLIWLSYSIVLLPFLLVTSLIQQRNKIYRVRYLFYLGEWAALIISAVICGGVITFALYFVGLHSVEHFREFWSRNRHLAVSKKSTIIAFITLLAIGLIIGIYGIRYLLTDWLPAFDLYLGLEVAIVGIAALSLPHIILIDWLRQNER